MKLQVTSGRDSSTICAAGDLDIYNVEATRERLLDHLADKAGLELDLAGVETCDAAGLQLLVSARRSAVAGGKLFRILNPAPAVKQCGELLGVKPETWHSPDY